jgi:RNA polymerase sigma factor (sigma-70 family)
MRDDPSGILLVTRARAGDQQAWNALVERYAPLVWSLCRRYQLGGADAADAGQNVWLHLVDQLGNIRDPAALPGWLATTTRRECGRVLRARRSPPAVVVLDAENIPDQHTGLAEHELLVAERHAALREAFTDLPSRCQRLIGMLTDDPPAPYAKISAELGIPIGSIGPTRSRCLDMLRRHPAITALIHAGPSEPGKPGLPGEIALLRQRSADHQSRRPYLDNLRAATKAISPAASRAESAFGLPG